MATSEQISSSSIDGASASAASGPVYGDWILESNFGRVVSQCQIGGWCPEEINARRTDRQSPPRPSRAGVGSGHRG